jgi:WD40 repeat protein
VVLSGDRAGKVFYSNYQTGEVGSMLGSHKNSVESVDISKAFPLAVSGGIDDKVLIYDVNHYTQRSEIFIGSHSGTTKLKFSEVDPNLVWAASTLGELRLLDVRASSVVKTFLGHIDPITDFVEVPERNLIVTASEDKKCFIFDIRDGQLGLVEAVGPEAMGEEQPELAAGGGADGGE